MARANDQLKQDEWLTMVSRTDIDKASARILHMRNALARAKIITADYIQIGAFYDVFFDVAMDLETLDDKAGASDFLAIAVVNEKLKPDTAKAIQLEHAPGLPPEVDSLLHDIQTFATDVSKLLKAVTANDISGLNASVAALQADASKLEKYDFNKIGDEIDGFYEVMIDAYNSEIAKANKS